MGLIETGEHLAHLLLHAVVVGAAEPAEGLGGREVAMLFDQPERRLRNEPDQEEEDGACRAGEQNDGSGGEMKVKEAKDCASVSAECSVNRGWVIQIMAVFTCAFRVYSYSAPLPETMDVRSYDEAEKVSQVDSPRVQSCQTPANTNHADLGEVVVSSWKQRFHSHLVRRLLGTV